MNDIGHPQQSVLRDRHGVDRFRVNEIVAHLFKISPLDMNDLAILPFSDEDRRQFAQLMGYSVCGYSDLPYTEDCHVDEPGFSTEINGDDVRIQVVNMRAGDVVCLMCAGKLSEESMQRLRKSFLSRCPEGVLAVVLEEGLTVGVLRFEDGQIKTDDGRVLEAG